MGELAPQEAAVKHWACRICTLINVIRVKRCPACSAYPPAEILDIQKELGVYKPKAQQKSQAAAPAAARKKAASVAQKRLEASKRLHAHMRKVAPRKQAFVAHHFPKHFSAFVPKSVAAKLDLKQRTPYIEEAPLTEQPRCIKNGEMRGYQLRGLNFMRNLHANGISGILGDEMGLGKTLQTISMFAYLHDRGHSGPHLVVCPLSVLSSWLAELKRWCPALRCARLHGNPKQRARTFREEMVVGEFDVCVTSYEMVKAEIGTLTKRYMFDYLVIDEAHCIKNEETQLWAAMRKVPRANCLLLTGTPLQNNLHELWALLNFLLPDVFASSDIFDSCFNLAKSSVDKSLLAKVHDVLTPLMLRRTKDTVEKDLPPKTETLVYVGLSEYQVWWYKRFLGVEASFLFGDYDPTRAPRTRWKQLRHLFMQLRKVSSHPFLIPDAEKEPFVNDERLINASQKLVILDKLLVRLKAEGRRVLIFSLFTKMLDILEDFARFRGYDYLRLDGSTHRARRNVDIGKFNAPGSKYFIYLISTRAGGLGINLHTADTVVHFDSDWNPQADLQAQARSHRIGQKKPVTVYRLVSEGTVEERMVLRAQQKLYLDAMVTGRQLLESENDVEEELDEKELLKMLRFGAQRIFQATSDKLKDDDLDAVLDRSRVVPKFELPSKTKSESNSSGSPEDDSGSTSDKENANERNNSSSASSRKRASPSSLDSLAVDSYNGKTHPKKKIKTENGVGAARPLASSSRAKAESKHEGEGDGEEELDKAAAAKRAGDFVSANLQSNVERNAAEFDPELMPTFVRQFQGTTYTKEKAKEETLQTGPRQRASRMIFIDGQAVLKDNDYDMEDDSMGCMPELGVLSAAQSIKARRKKKRFLHESICFNCRDGGLIMLCTLCPKSYHPQCAGYSRPPSHQWRCISHECHTCGRTTSTAGFMFRCVHCPLAYCEDHAPPAHYGRPNMEGRLDLDSCPSLEARGYPTPPTLGWMLCSLQCQREHDETAGMPENDDKTEWELLPPLVRDVLTQELRRAHQHYNLVRFQPPSSSSSPSPSSSSAGAAAASAQSFQPNPVVPLNFGTSSVSKAVKAVFESQGNGGNGKRPPGQQRSEPPLSTSLSDVPGFTRRIGSIPARSDMMQHLCQLLCEREDDATGANEAELKKLPLAARRQRERERAAAKELERQRPVKTRIAEWSGITIDVSRPLAEQRSSIARQFTEFFDDFDTWTKPGFRLLTQLVGLKVLMPDTSGRGGNPKWKKAAKAAASQSARKPKAPKPRRSRDVNLGEHQSRVACYVALQIVCPSSDSSRTVIDYRTLQNAELFEYGY